jgi:hypothetical protein
MSLANRLQRLERAGPEKCRGLITCILTHTDGEPEPEVPEDAARCRYCGQVHVLRLQHVVVATREEAINP